MPARELTDLSLRSLPSVPGRQVDVYDSRVRGFGVRVSPNGTKSFFVYYRVGRTARRLTLGRYPNMRLGEARERARSALLAVSDGRDPAVAKQIQRDRYQADLFPAVVDAFIDRYAKIHTRRWHETKRILERAFVAAWQRRTVRDLTQADVNVIIDGIVDRGTPASAIQALAAVRKLFNWAIERGYVESSPCAHIGPPAKLSSRDRVLSDEELAAVWQAASTFGYPFGPIVQLLVLTGQRRNEVAGMRRSNLDLAGRLWSLPASQTKSGRAHVVPLTATGVCIINEVPMTGGDLLFAPQDQANPPSGFSKWKRALDEASGVEGWRLHDIRRTVSTGMARLQVPPHVVQRLLNHTTGSIEGVAAIYNRFGYLDEMRAALEEWEIRVTQGASAG
jgi:integrase